MLNDLFILFVLIIISAFFSCAEMAFVVSNKIKIEIKARKKDLSAQNAFFFANKPQDFFSTILIGNNIVNIAFASIATLFLARMFGLGEGGILIISTLVILIFGELIPKYFGRELSDTITLLASIPIRLVSFVLYPFVKITSSVSSLITQSSSESEEHINFLFSKEDIEHLVKESQQAGAVNKTESDIISRFFSLGSQRVYEVMRPRTEIVGIEISQNIDEVIGTFIDSGFSKIPVYEDNIDNIKGVIFAYDLFRTPKDIQSIIREIIFVPETKRSFELLNDFLSKRVSIAIVIDEFGGTAGIITIEDIMEELFGEIRDEYDIEEFICRKTAENSYLISGKVEIDYINEKYGLNIPLGDYETINGFIISRIGRIPEQGENISLDNFNFLIVRGNNTRIDLIKLTAINEI